MDLETNMQSTVDLKGYTPLHKIGEQVRIQVKINKLYQWVDGIIAEYVPFQRGPKKIGYAIEYEIGEKTRIHLITDEHIF